MDRGAWRATVHGVTQSQTRLNDLAHMPRASCLVAVLPRMRKGGDSPQKGCPDFVSYK